MSSSYSDTGGGQAPHDGAGRLVIVLPHWAAAVNVYDHTPSRVAAGPARQGEDGRWRVEVVLNPGIYAVEVTLEGKCERLHALVRPGETHVVGEQPWPDLNVSSAAPLKGTATPRGPYGAAHPERAEEASRTPTWGAAPGGDSSLFVFVRTLQPKKFRRFAEGLRLLSADGEPLVEFEGDAVALSEGEGWLAFNAELPPGFYVLGKGRGGVRPRHQPVYLCRGWQTQVFLAARWTASLGTMTVNMARPEHGFSADDETALAADVLLDAERRCEGAALIFDNEKMNALVGQAERNPWLGIVAAYALCGQHKSGRVTDRYAAMSAQMRTALMQSLEGLGDHPDVKALRLDPETPAPVPFPYPPMLRAGLKLVQHHATRFASTVTPDSLTACVLEDLVYNSQWTAWRHLERMPDFGRPRSADEAHAPTPPGDADASFESIAKVPRRRQTALREPARSRNYTTALLRSAAPSLPVYRLGRHPAADVAGEEKTRAESIYAAPATFATVRSTPLFQFAEKLLSEAYVIGDAVRLDFSGLLAELFEGLTPREISSASGLPLSRVREGFDRLKRVCAGEDSTVRSDAALSAAERAVFEYALRRGEGIGGPAKEEAGVEPGAEAVSPGNAPPVTIEECVGTLKEEAERLASVPEPFAGAAGELSGKLRDLADSLQRHADLLIITDPQGRMLYGNGTFIRLLSGEGGEPLPSLRHEWEFALASAPATRGRIEGPTEGGRGPWEFRRIAVADEGSGIVQAYMNVLRLAGLPRLAEGALAEVKKLLPEVSLHASLLALGDDESKHDYLLKLKELVADLERVSLDRPA